MLTFFLIALAICGTNASFLATVALKQKNTDILFEALHNVSDPTSKFYGKYWSQGEINDLVAPKSHEISWMLTTMKDRGITCSSLGSALQCENVPSINYFSGNIANYIDFIEFIDTNYWNVHNHKSFPVENGDGYVGREVLNELYNITYNTIQHNSSICSVEYQGASGFSPTDLYSQQKLNAEPHKNVYKINGPNDPQNPMLEAQLDMQMMSQVAENVDLWYWGSNLWLFSFATQFLNSTKIPEVLSMSWGWAEKQQCTIATCNNITSAQYIQRVNTEYAKIGLRGVSICVARGDAGAPGRTDEGCDDGSGVNPLFPGSSPYVTSVSATYVVPTNVPKKWKTPLCQQYGCVNGNHELPTNYNITGWTTGGGFGIFSENRPSWQSQEVEAYLNSGVKLPTKFNRKGRGYPDVSAVGHNCPVINMGSIMGVDGTSCASPIFASIIALLNDYQKSKGKPVLGFANPLLYKMYHDEPNTFHDITQGNNWCTEYQCCLSGKNGYSSSKGWDPVTGLGTPNVGRMLAWLDTHT